MIETVEHIYKSISNRVDVSIGARFKDIEFSYKFSKETQHMIDNVVKRKQTSIVSLHWCLYP